MGNKKNKIRVKRKRKFEGNQHSNNCSFENNNITDTSVAVSEAEENADPVSTSAKKLKLNIEAGLKDLEENEDTIDFKDGVIFMELGILKTVFESFSRCEECFSPVIFSVVDSKKQGFANKLKLTCSKQCSWSHSFFSSSKLPRNPNSSLFGNKRFNINARLVVAGAMDTFSTLMDMPTCVSNFSYNEINKSIHPIYQECADESMKRAASEIRNQIDPNVAEDKTVDSDICIDGSWQKRGYSSLVGTVTGVSRETKKVLDVEVFSKFCHKCCKWEKRKGSPEYDEWKLTHVCSKNHHGSSGSMEAIGAVNMFARSEEKHNLRYAHYIGDGDTEAYRKVVESKPYAGLVPKKLECCGHVQKRLGTRLRTIRKDKKVLSDGKKIGGKGRLTDKMINKMQNYYGMAIRQNKGALYAMKKSVLAVLWHNTNFDTDEIRHQFCPRTINSWCRYQSDKITGMKTYKPSKGIPVVIKKELDKIFADLSSDELLSRCLEGTSQNPNEAFNQIIGQKCLKQTFLSREVLEVGPNSVIMNYNDGLLSFTDFSRN